MLFQIIGPTLRPPVLATRVRDELQVSGFQTTRVSSNSASVRAAAAIAAIDKALSAFNTGTVECRSAAAEMIDVDRSGRIITAVAVPYESPANVVFRGQYWTEVFSRGSFGGIEQRANKIRVNRNHDRALTCGKVIHFDPNHRHGLVAEIRIARTVLGDETLALAAEDCLSASVGFAVPSGGDQLDHRSRVRRITRADLDHLSLVESPAYQDASVLAVG